MGKRANPPRRQRKAAPQGGGRRSAAGAVRRPVDEGPLLSPDYPVETCVVNADWQDVHMANVLLVRRTPSGLSCVGFLVDLQGVGLKDVAVHVRLDGRGLDRLRDIGFKESRWEECPLALARELVYGGVEWARRNGFRTPAEPLRYLAFLGEPAAPPDLSRFGGEDGRPLLVGDYGGFGSVSVGAVGGETGGGGIGRIGGGVTGGGARGRMGGQRRRLRPGGGVGRGIGGWGGGPPRGPGGGVEGEPRPVP